MLVKMKITSIFSSWSGTANFCSIFKNSGTKQNCQTSWFRICINQSAAIKIRAIIVNTNHSRSKLNTLYVDRRPKLDFFGKEAP